MTDQPTVQLRPLDDAEFSVYRARSVPAYADELVLARGADRDAAMGNAEETFPESLQAVAEEGQWIFRVTADGADVGWLWIAPAPLDGDGLFIYDVEVDEPHRGRGLGRATMLAAEDFAREQGHDRIGLNVFGWNQRAESLYRSLGYEVMSTQMRKTLDGGH